MHKRFVNDSGRVKPTAKRLAGGVVRDGAFGRRAGQMVSWVLVFLIVGAVRGMSEKTEFHRQCAELIAQQGKETDGERLHHLFSIAWAHQMAEYPEQATETGYPGYDDRWRDVSLEAVARRHREQELQVKVLESIDRSALSEDDRISYDLFHRDLVDDIELARFRPELLPISQLHGVHQHVPRLLSMMPVRTDTQLENIFLRLSGVPQLVDQTILLLEEGLKMGITPPQVCLRETPRQVRNQIVDDPSQAPVLAAFADLPDAFTPERQEKIRKRAYAIYADNVVPAFGKLHDYLVETYLPGCRESIAWSDLPNGDNWYSHLVGRYTTTDLTPNEVFSIGLSEVERIRQEMDEVIAKTGFEGGFAAFCQHLRTEPQFFYEQADDLVTAYRDIAKRVDPQLPKMFGRLPRLPYGVIPIPDYAARSQTTAYYQPGSSKAGRPGYYYVNTYDLTSRPKWEMEALTLHEAVPGHHLQIALAEELEALPEFRRQGWITAFGEGWALYAESLGEEMGFYSDPYSKFGRLTYEMWRAIRLVVDVGMHAKGWSRQQAIDYFKENSSKTEHDIQVETDRYIVWPGQALAYKIGELKIRELRAYAEEELGEDFDIRAFHDELLGRGCLPLNILETVIKDWVGLNKRR